MLTSLITHDRSIIPYYKINYGYDIKFDTNPLDLNSLMTINEYKYVITNINNSIKPARKNKIDLVLLILSPLIIPIIPLFIRQYYKNIRHETLLLKSLKEFNETHSNLILHWWKKPVKQLTIERLI